MDMRYMCYETSFGEITLVAYGEKLIGLAFGAIEIEDAYNEENGVLYDAIIQLNQFCHGERKEFDLPLLYGGTPFERKVWDYLKTIPYGKLVSYETVARGIGEPLATRAVGLACNNNPLPIFIPCHRVVNKNGGPGGYVAGVEKKIEILKLERANANKEFVAGTYEAE